MNNKKFIKIDLKLKDFILAFITLFLVCVYPCMYMYFQNVSEVKIVSIEPPFLLFFISGLFIWIIVILLFMDVNKATLFTSIVLMLLINYMVIYNLVSTVLTFLDYNQAYICLTILVVLLLVLVKKIKGDFETANQVIAFVLAGLIIFNFVTTIPVIMNMNKKVKKVEVEQFAKDRSYKENIYYLIFDEYGGIENLKYYFDYDNSDFYKYLEGEGFSVSYGSHNVEAIETKDIIPNILNLNYVAKVADPINPELTTDTALHRFYKDMGYQINLINHYDTLRYEDDYHLLSNYVKGEIDDPDYVFKKKIYSNSILYPIYDSHYKNTGKDQVRKTELEETERVINDVLTMSERTGGKPTFTLVYLMLPHSPFIYNEDGTLNTEGTADWDNKYLYINQLKYTNTIIKQMIQNIKKNDPKSTIVMQSDHGCRLAGHLMKDYKKSEYDAEKETYMMQNVFNCVYTGSGKSMDIEGLSCVNTWRLLLNTLYDTDYKMLDEPERFIYKWRYADGFQM